MRTVVRAGAVALAAGTLLLGNAVTAQAATTGKVTVKVDRLILEPGRYGHTGTIRIVIKNGTDQPVSGGNLTITEPLPASFTTFDGAGGCTLDVGPDGRETDYCGLEQTIQPGQSGTVTIGFTSPAKPQKYAQIAPNVGTVEYAGSKVRYGAVFRSTTGSLSRPRVYHQDTESKLTVTADAGVTLTKQEDGTFAGHLPITVHSDGDAPHKWLHADIITPAGVSPWPMLDPSGPCVGSSDDLPIPAGGAGEGCDLFGVRIAEGETQTYDLRVRAPEGTAAGSLGTVTTRVQLGAGPAQTDGANLVAFAVNVAG
ncbi:hypothetical protein ACWT_3810 [Actinoplanes sp. SE50]|uniref:hypothetical protein n=1 Tax=unclassified Actinoplanes TaxID=2626549 RepID=UPI00023ECCC9|nr:MULTISPECIES: hypothetical protein [unclassified Actinoplanes]AEV84833.1 hypothetical protein ACPL_3938 [Actinoplanes sp. SE50/110]ATO83225.1 hypothetical protein ACWT_3810 [Actinoplanes sp. SE50]SLM00632.1 hypothetical protein ACSP50_3865 [Actinoplanes sp. SE50/110]